MTPNLLLLLLELVATGTAGKYVYVRFQLNWFEAQTYCRTNYTDLAPIHSEYDNGLIQKLNPNVERYSWIGLMNTTNSSTWWMWSGGGEVTTFFWRKGEPNDNHGNEEYGAIVHGDDLTWNDAPAHLNLAFLCYKVHAIRTRMTWDEALQYCRKNHHDLASVASETEIMLMEKELRKKLSSVDVWVGLNFLDANWQWMDGQPFKFENWGPFEKPICPDNTFACGALRVQGPVQKVGTDKLANVSGIQGWNACDCTWKLHVLCY